MSLDFELDPEKAETYYEKHYRDGVVRRVQLAANYEPPADPIESDVTGHGTG